VKPTDRELARCDRLGQSFAVKTLLSDIVTSTFMTRSPAGLLSSVPTPCPFRPLRGYVPRWSRSSGVVEATARWWRTYMADIARVWRSTRRKIHRPVFMPRFDFTAGCRRARLRQQATARGSRALSACPRLSLARSATIAS